LVFRTMVGEDRGAKGDAVFGSSRAGIFDIKRSDTDDHARLGGGGVFERVKKVGRPSVERREVLFVYAGWARSAVGVWSRPLEDEMKGLVLRARSGDNFVDVVDIST